MGCEFKKNGQAITDDLICNAYFYCSIYHAVLQRLIFIPVSLPVGSFRVGIRVLIINL